jgi:hypothetical protein
MCVLSLLEKNRIHLCAHAQLKLNLLIYLSLMDLHTVLYQEE